MYNNSNVNPVTRRVRRADFPESPPVFPPNHPLEGRSVVQVVLGPSGDGWWTVRLEPLCDAFQGRLSGGTQKQAAESWCRIKVGGDAEVAPMICTWPVNQVVEFSLWGNAVSVEGLPLLTAVGGNPGPDFCATISPGQVQNPKYPSLAQQTESIDADNAQRVAVPPYAIAVQVNVETSGANVEASWVSETDGGVPLVRHIFPAPDTGPPFVGDGNVKVAVPPDAAWLDLSYAPAATLVNLVWELRP